MIGPAPRGTAASWLPRVLAVLCLGLVAAPAAEAQELRLKRELPPPVETDPCVGMTVEAPSSEEDRSEARSLMQTAMEARILGDMGRARELLEQAASTDPSIAEVHFELGRVLEGLGEEEAAVEAFCRYLALEPSGADRTEAEGELERLATIPEDSIPPAARAAYREGVERFDSGEYDAAVREFSRALVERPDWANAHFNRGLAYLEAGREGAGLSDLEQYLELRPNAREAREIRARLAAAEPPPPSHSATTALVSGVVVPGMGHFYIGRPGTGALYLIGAAGAAAAGVLVTETEIVCRLGDVTEGCPPEFVVEERTERPFLVPGLGAAGAITLVGAIHAFFRARGDDGGGRSGAAAEMSLLPEGGMGPVSELTLTPRWDPARARATFGVRAKF